MKASDIYARMHAKVWTTVAQTHCPNLGSCEEWTGYLGDHGYGLIWSSEAGKKVFVHRVAWEEKKNGPVPEGLCVLHRCDNKPCCRRDHLFSGTRKDNNEDKGRKGRSKNGGGSLSPAGRLSISLKVRGSGNGHAVFTEQQVLCMREDVAAGRITQKQLAALHARPLETINTIMLGRTWAHVGGPLASSSRLTDEKEQEIVATCAKHPDWSGRAVGRHCGVDSAVVRRVVPSHGRRRIRTAI